jgi:hypothetical protein
MQKDFEVLEIRDHYSPRDFRAAFAPSLLRARRVFFGKCAIVFFFLSAGEALRTRTMPQPVDLGDEQ